MFIPHSAFSIPHSEDSAFRIPHSALEQSIRTLVPSYAFALDVHSALRIQHSAFGGFRIPNSGTPWVFRIWGIPHSALRIGAVHSYSRTFVRS
jgi:hypothetical protein